MHNLPSTLLELFRSENTISNIIGVEEKSDVGLNSNNKNPTA